MTREEFIQVLEKEGYSYQMEGEQIVVTGGRVNLSSLVTLPPGVQFKNKGYVDLRSLESLPPGVQFKNKGDVDLRSLVTLPPDVQFKNGGIVDLRSLVTLPPGIRFENKVSVNLRSLVGGWFSDWEGNITGIRSTRLLNLMISKGLFER